MRVVLLRDPGGQLESDFPIPVAVFSAELGEHPRQGVGADPSVERTEAPNGPCRVQLPVSTSQGVSASKPAPAIFSKPNARPRSHSPALIAMITARSAVAPVAHALTTLYTGRVCPICFCRRWPTRVPASSMLPAASMSFPLLSR